MQSSKLIAPPLTADRIGEFSRWSRPREDSPTVAHAVAYGALSYLGTRDKRVLRWTNAKLRAWYQPGILSGQFYSMYEGETPRAMIVWAHLTDNSHREFLETREPPALHDWYAGENLWIMGVLCPYTGPQRQVLNWLVSNIASDEVHAFRAGDGDIDRVCHYKRTPSGFVKTCYRFSPAGDGLAP